VIFLSARRHIINETNQQAAKIPDNNEEVCDNSSLIEQLIMLRKKYSLLEKEMDCMNKIINLIRDGVVVSNSQGIVLSANLAVEQLTGLHINDLVGKDLKQLADAGVFINEPASFVARRQKALLT